MICNNCNKYKEELEKYKKKYEDAKSGLSKEERGVLVELICNEQLKHLIANGDYNSEDYYILEQLKAKIRII